MPFILIILKFMVNNKLKVDIHTNLRIGLMKNFIESIQTLKIFVWEKYFMEKVSEERKKETTFLRRFDISKSVLISISFGGISLIVFCTFLILVNKNISLNLGETLLVINCLLTIQQFVPVASIISLAVLHINKLAIKKVE